MASCQCGISRSATVLLAYLLYLNVAGMLHAPDLRGATLHETYAWAKNRNPMIGPNLV